VNRAFQIAENPLGLNTRKAVCLDTGLWVLGL